MYKIKEKPEDFFVREISNVKVGEKGEYSYFILKKRNYTTIRALQHIAEALKINPKKLGFAGSKDKNAVTEQVVSAKGVGKERLESVNLRDIEIKYLGKGEKPLSLGDLEGNYFKIIARDAEKQPKTLSKFKNFFGEQRFSKNNAEVGKAIVKKDFENAARLIMENEGEHEKSVREHLKQKQNDYVTALKKIPKKILQMYVHAYQSSLWNMMAEQSDEEEIPLIGFGTDADGKIKQILKREGITTRDFIIKEIPELSSEGGMRKVFADVDDLKIKQTDKTTIEFEFTLPKGSYATEFIKQCFTG
jgi:tRNA pseudouridine13 synthase